MIKHRNQAADYILSYNELMTWCADYDPDILLADGFEEAFLGVGNAFRDEPVAVYDRNKCIDMLAKDFKRHADYNITEQKTWDDNEETDFYEQAMEYFDYNVQGAYVGDKTPIFITLIETN